MHRRALSDVVLIRSAIRSQPARISGKQGISRRRNIEAMTGDRMCRRLPRPRTTSLAPKVKVRLGFAHSRRFNLPRGW